MKRTISALAAVCMLAAVATAATQTRGYNWDNGNTNYWVTGPSFYGGSSQVVSDPDANFPQNRVLKLTKLKTSTESTYLVHVEGLLDNDQVIVTYKMRNQSLSGSSSTKGLKIWGAEDNHWGNADPKSGSTWNNCTPYDFNYSGLSAGALNSLTKTWFTQSCAYTFKTVSPGYANATGMLFEVRYLGSAIGEVGYVDDIQVTCPDYCWVTFPDGTNGYDVTPVSMCINPLFGDLDFDCMVNMNDMGVAANNWLASDVNDVATVFPSGVQTLGYGWEDGVIADPNMYCVAVPSANGPTYTFNYPYSYKLVADPCHATPYALELAQGNSGNGEFYVATIDGLYNGDKVVASAWLKSGNSDINGGSGSGQQHVRLWAVYTSASTGRYAGSAGGDEAYSLADWRRFSHEWTFDAGSPTRGGMVIEIRAYGKYRDISGYVDDIVISAPVGATITFPHGMTGTTVTQAPFCATRPIGDLNVDCVVNMSDFAMMAADWLKCGLTVCP
jgi:hypothetical protein